MSAGTCAAQANRSPSKSTFQSAANDEIVELNLSGTVKVTALLELMSKELGIRFLHGTDIAQRDVTVYTPAKLPKSVLPTLLGSLLREANLAIVDSDVAGWKRVVDIGDILSNARTGDAEEVTRRNGPAAAVTQVIPIKYIDVTTISTSLKPFMSKTGSNIIALAEQNLLIVTGYAADVQEIVEMLRMIDKPKGQGSIEIYLPVNRSPESLIAQAESIMAGGASRKPGGDDGPKLFHDRAGARILVAGQTEVVTEIVTLLRQLDTGSGALTKVYRLQYVSATRIDKLVKGFVQPGDAKDQNAEIETTVDEEGNLLVIRASDGVHRQVEMLIKELDRAVDSAESPIQFYKLKNATAIEVLYSLMALQQATGSGGVAQAGGLQAGAFGTLGGLNVGGVYPVGAMVGNMGFNPNATVSMPPQPITSTSPQREANQNSQLSPLIANNSGGFANPGFAGGQLGGFGGPLGNGFGSGFAGGGFAGGGQVATLPGGARISADVATNSLIIYAPANVQPLYEKLIRSLDQRRPQVLIEADIVAVDTSNNFSLGVEISGGDRQGAKRLFKFTSFGLSEVDPTDGSLTINPALGFNGVLIDPEVADVIVQALSAHTRSRVLASPKILVNDNQTGNLESVASVPFQSVNAADTIATTSLGGTQQAGTTIEVTPHINEDDHLQLEFRVEFSTFVGEGTAALPPPRQIDSLGSVVTIPDGKTVVVGGLKRSTDSNTFTGVPWAEKVPILRELTSLRTEANSTTSFFLFIRPRILRDSQFRDLQYLSHVETQDAELSGDYPRSGPMLIPCPTPPPQPVTLPSRVTRH
ncbi:Type II secretion system protein D precursor [Stieleria varia]|uniref:Type II secretion system protein D n=2 Tax=Stieleria varia TaxID=2528005 RepID=A0A5C6AEJ8_9BACT|nr:Type II secretion system protein D precursor [Stieleria varia]